MSYNFVPNLAEGEHPRGRNGRIGLRTSGTNGTELFMAKIRERMLNQIKAPEAREISKELGFAEGSYNHFIQSAIRAGHLKKNPGKYNGKDGKMSYTVKETK